MKISPVNTSDNSDVLLLSYLGAFGANNIPKCLKSITILGIQQARKWGLGSMNEFRKFFGLKTYDTFEDLNATGVSLEGVLVPKTDS